MSTKHIPQTSPDPVEAASTYLVGGGILTMALFPLALPLIALLAVAAIPLLLIGVAAALVAAALAAPVVLLRGAWRRIARMRGRRPAERPTAHHEGERPTAHHGELVAGG